MLHIKASIGDDVFPSSPGSENPMSRNSKYVPRTSTLFKKQLLTLNLPIHILAIYTVTFITVFLLYYNDVYHLPFIYDKLPYTPHRSIKLVTL